MGCHHHYCPQIDLWIGYTNLLKFKISPDIRYVPIPTLIGSQSILSSATLSAQSTPKKRSRCTSLQGSPIETSPRDKYVVPSELDLNVKGLFRGTCAITGTKNKWGSRMVAGPELQTCHIIPNSMYHHHPDEELSDDGKRTAMNSRSNCMAMDASCHKFHDHRLVAVQHVRLIQTLFLVVADSPRVQIVFGCLHL